MADTAEQLDLTRYMRWFEESQTLTQEARQAALVDQDYYDGKQWTAAEKAALADRKQPDSVFNRIRPAINGTLGVLDQGQTDPRAFGRNPQDEQAADVASKVLRYAADMSRFDRTKIDLAKDYMVQGIGAVVVEVDEDRQIVPKQIRFEEFFYDPYSRRPDFKDARYLGVAKWMYADDVAALYPDQKEAVSSVLDGSSPLVIDSTFEDRPTWGGQWVDGKKRRVMVVEIYHKEGGRWLRCVFFRGGVLAKGESPYTDHKRRPDCPIEAQACYVDRDNNRYGLVRDMRGPQDEINKRRSKLLHLLSVSQIQAVDPAAVEVDANAARAEAAKPDGVIPFGWQKVQTTDMATGQASLLAEAKAEIERMGPNPAILGRQGADSSGRAVLARQQAGLTEQAIIFGGVEDLELRVYRQMWARAKQFWTAPMYIRVTDDVKAPEFVGVNQPKMGPPQIVMGEGGMPTLQPTVLGYENALAEMDVDIVISSTPDTANLQQEQFMALVDLAKAGAPIPPQLLLECSSIPNKAAIIEKLEAASQQPDPAKELALEQGKADLEETQSKTALNTAKAQTESMAIPMQAFQAGLDSVEPAAGETGVSASQGR